MTAFEVFKWLVACASIVGVLLNTHHKRACFLVWGCTNSAWVVMDAVHGVWAQATLQMVYVGLSVYGWRRWKGVRG